MTASLLAALLLSAPAAAPPPLGDLLVAEGKTLNQWLAILRTSKGDEWAEAVEALSEFGPRAAEALPLLLADLDRTEPDSCDRRASVLNTIAAMGPVAKPAIPRLLKLIRRGGLRDPVRALHALDAMGPSAEPAIPALLESFDALPRHSVYRNDLPLALAHIGPSHKGVRSRLARALEDRNEEMRIYAAWALWRLKDPRVDVPKVIAQAETSKEPADRLVLAKWLCEVDTHRPEVRDALIRLLGDADRSVRQRAIQGLERHRPQGEGVAAVYRRTLKSEDWFDRHFAAEALGEMKEKPRAAVGDLKKLLGDSTRMVRSAAGFSLWQIDPAQRGPALAAICPALDDDSLHTRAHAIKRLSRMGRDAQTALPLLRKCQKDSVAEVREESEKAIKAITAATAKTAAK